MLISKKRLLQALNHFDDRNILIKELVHASENEKNLFFKRVLAFWLGSNISREMIHKPRLTTKCQQCIDAVYFCILLLDKQMSLLDRHSAAFRVLKNTLFGMLDYYNGHFLLLVQEPRTILTAFIQLVQTINYQSCPSSSDRKILEHTQKACLGELSISQPQPGPWVTQAANDVPSITKVNPFNMGIAINKLITANFNQSFFFPMAASQTKTHLVEKLFIQARDGIVLEGLSVKEKNKKNKTVVLALIGHFQAEHSYLNTSFYSFQALFDTQLVIINHRNYSRRSNKFAAHPQELAEDVVAFARYFVKKKQRVVLYGMCGGAAHMILAANSLLNQKIPFKLIADRFSQRYIDFADYKTLSRARNHMNTLPGGFQLRGLTAFYQNPFFVYCLTVFLFTILFLLSKSALALTKATLDFGQLIQAIPETDRLILQAKGKKSAPGHEPTFTDMIVHPQNDLRHAVKEKRKQRKSLLNNLAENCLKAAGNAVFSQEIQAIFLQLSQRFHQCLELISNEKLMDDANSDTVTDLHSRKLYTLTTRNKLPIHQLITGFFRQPGQSFQPVIDSFTAYSSETIVATLEQLYGHSPAMASHFSLFAKHLALFLQELKANESFLVAMADRLTSTQLPDLQAPGKALLASALFQRMSQNLLQTNAPALQ
ncbi:alpha/beta hydrolase family protein [Legionella taurinensis]|uniref:Alpha/beta hydrolase n=3 Tax=Legionella taurinensis TaxID=70611 RepID=A0A3A5L537_9GAMM|nr:hypothetical protein [Legionella taurinensis]RJT47893.1 hypothetical protein D6J04_04785 [Legionella taurinensis]RJT68107.1 hypothetical protein D6J03_04910 [Legionella taurinensis]STY25721.1 Uncharacterised protein [Legionella taurinensis]